MNFTRKENINRESKVLKHKIALETKTLLEGKENILNTEIELYTTIAVVDNFIQEDLLSAINEDERDFELIIEEEVEKEFAAILEEYNYTSIYEEIVEDVIEYFIIEEQRSNTVIGILNTIIDLIDKYNWDDLKYFINDKEIDRKETIAAMVEDNGEINPNLKIQELMSKYKTQKAVIDAKQS